MQSDNTRSVTINNKNSNDCINVFLQNGKKLFLRLIPNRRCRTNHPQSQLPVSNLGKRDEFGHAGNMKVGMIRSQIQKTSHRNGCCKVASVTN